MTMTERVTRLRKQSLEAVPRLSDERGRLMTEFYRTYSELTSTPVMRARSFNYLLDHMTIGIQPGELIVGEKGPSPKATPTYPELCCHSLSDLDLLDSRAKIPYKVDVLVRGNYEKIIVPFWQGRSMRDRIFADMTPEWKAAYEGGVFTEFMEQRAPGHTVLDDKIYHKGMLDFITDIQTALDGLDFLADPQAYDRQEELKAMEISARALLRFAGRYAELSESMATKEIDPVRKVELEQIAEVCRWVPAHAPRTFREALQYYWFVHLGVTIELNTWDSFCPGHLDQHLFPFFKRESSAGTLTRESAEELLQCFWIKFNNQPAPPKVGVTAAESGTYTDFAQINLGGLMPDGSDAVSELTYLMLDVIEDMRLLQPSSSIQVSKQSPDGFIQRAARIIRTGFGQPSIFNSDLIVEELVRQGKDLVDARQGGSSGCVEVGAFGKENYNLTGYFNLPKVLEITLHDGIDPRTGRRIGISCGDQASFKTFDDFFIAFEKQMRYFVDVKVRGNNVVERLYAAFMPAPFLSLLTDDCIARGMDYHAGGARYNTSYIQGVGIGTITDALVAIDQHVFIKKSLPLAEMIQALDADFSGFEKLHQLLINRTLKYGNDDDVADQVMVRVFNAYFNAVDGRPNTKRGTYHINMLPTTVHIYFGSITGATADGRRAAAPLSEGISPVQGADRHGPTAVLCSAARMDQVRTGGTLLNQKLTPELLKDDEGLMNLVQLVRGYFKMDGHHIQFNVVDAATLRAAKEHPEQHRDLIVRVAGYSDYFCDLSEALQEEIISRTEQKAL
jgi:pyruvate formate-lyase/glycerol dehydratase family glycyl radical enzyme